MAAIKKFPIMKVVYLQLFKVYRVCMKILQLSNTYLTLVKTNSKWYLDMFTAPDTKFFLLNNA